MSLNFFDRQRSALVLLADAARARAAAETELATNFRTAADKAEREVARARKANATAREKELGEIDTAHDEAVEEITGRADTAKFAAVRAHDEKRDATEERFEAAEKKARAEYQDRLWSIDSILEAGEKQAKDQRDSLERAAAAGEFRVAKLWGEAIPLLARGRVTREDVEPETVSVPDDDFPGRGLEKAISAAEAALDDVRELKLPRYAGFKGFGLCFLVASVVGAVSFVAFPPAAAGGVTGSVGLVLGLAAWFVLRVGAHRQTRRAGGILGEALAAAEAAAQHLNDFAAKQYTLEHARLVERHTRKRRDTAAHYEPLLAKQEEQRDSDYARIEAEHQAATTAAVRQRKTEIRAEEESYKVRRSEAEAQLDSTLRAAEIVYAEKLAAATAARDAAWGRTAAAWRAATEEVTTAFLDLRAQGSQLFPVWDTVYANAKSLATAVPAGVRFGEMVVDPHAIPDGVSADAGLAPPAEMAGPMPAFLPFPDRCSIILKARDEGRTAAVTALQAMMLRFLTGLPPGKVRFTIVDPVGLGDNFASFMHLADFDEKLVTSQIWTEGRQIEQRLVDLTDHIASVIQKYLRNQYKSIEEYNQAAGEVAEPYRVLVVANFPTGFSPEAARRLVSIATSGPSCGVCVLASVDARATMPRDFALADLEAPSLTLNWRDGRFTAKDPALAPFSLTLDAPPEQSVVAALVQRVGRASKEAVRVEVPFEYIAPAPGDVWRGSAAKGFEVPVGRAGATRRQVFTLGRGTAQHALIAGKTGSGKSTLLHALITNLAMIYSPDEAELYLIDFKEGVEFQWYATYRLPHARVVAIQSEREFGLSVLQRLDEILRDRGERFRDAGVNDLAGYRTATPGQKTPRILLVVDEFQQFFVEDDKLAQEASLLLDRLVRQGRAFGLHVLLGSQTLGGAYSLARSTIDQMAVRVALQCSDADAQLILSKDNNAARLLSRPGEAIYNDQNGLVEGNDPFQVVWLSEEKREDVLRGLGERAAGQYPPPLVFEGNSAADPARNPALAQALDAPAWPTESRAPAAWLGDPVAIKAPTAAVFRPQGAANLLLIGQNEEAARGLFAATLLGLASQLPAGPSGDGPFTLLDGTPDDADDAEYLRRLVARLPYPTRAPDRSGVAAAIGDLAKEVDRRQKGESTDRSPRFVLVFGAHRFRELRKSEDDFSFGRRGADREPAPSERFAAILRDGPQMGVHVIVWCDSMTNLNRTFDRPLLREFGLRVLFQMSPTDSSTLMDSPAASRLGRNRALFLQEEQERPEKFRPYGLPEPEWLDRVAAGLRARVGVAEPVAT